MGLETATFLNGLTPSWPLSGDTKSQGDDHLRLIKATLQATFPNASRAFYLANMEFTSTAIVLDATDQNNYVGIDTTAADVNVTLPSALVTGDKGWSCEIFRTNTSGTNGIMVAPASGSISSPFGSVATCRIESPIVPVRFVWTGANWLIVRLGPLIGSSMNWDGATVPPGYRAADGTTYSTTTFAELAAALGTTTLRDKRGRVEAGLDNGAVNRLTATYFGTASVLGAVGGLESNNVILTHTHTASSGNDTPDHTHSGVLVSTNGYNSPGGATSVVQSANGGSSSGASVRHTHPITVNNAGSAAAHNIAQPTIITNKLVRVA